MARAFLAWLGFLAGASWAGIALAEAGRFSAGAAVAAGVVVGLAIAGGLAARAPRLRLDGAAAVAGLALVLTASLFPPVDTTLLSQDASVHRAAGRWLARTGGLGVPDPSLEGIPPDVRFSLFDPAAVGLTRISQSRLPGGWVVPSLDESVVYPSFAHLLAVWIAIADGLGGERAIALLGPIFAATAWWAIGLVALLHGNRGSALATVALLATWLPEHWFARFLMPEVPTQALVWGAVAAALLSDPAMLSAGPDSAAFGVRRPPGAGGAGWVGGVVCGAALGVAGFARLEQLTILVPSLLIARFLLPHERRVLPRGAFLPFALGVLHAGAHLLIVPTDYGKRISRVTVDAVAVAWVVLGGSPRPVAISLALIAAALGASAFVLHRLRRGLFTRLVAGALGLLVFASILGGHLPDELPALTWLGWYVPWPAWIAAAIGALPIAMPTGLGLALFLEALDQVVSPRVTNEHIWAARRLVTVVLPLVALAAGWAIARRDRPRTRAVARVGTVLVGLAIVLGSVRLAPLLGRRIQSGGAAFARQVAAALPPESAVLVGSSLDWLHLAPLLWLEGRDVLVERTAPNFAGSLAWRLDNLPPASGVFALSGAVVRPGETIDPVALLPKLPPGWRAEPAGSFGWMTRALERTTDRAPRSLVEQAGEVTLFRLERPPSAAGSTPPEEPARQEPSG